MKIRSSSQAHFAQVPKAQIERSSFDRSFQHKTTFDAGLLVPIYVDEALPGDTFNLRMTGFARLATPLKPVMDNMYMETFFFAVPIRLVWENWERFNGAQDNPDDSTDFVIPTMTQNAIQAGLGGLGDYFGIPRVEGLTHSVLWHRAYNLIYNEWFRDQNIQDSIPVNKGDSEAVATNYPLLRRGKRHDYFTSCLPWPQKGDAVTLGGFFTGILDVEAAPGGFGPVFGGNFGGSGTAELREPASGAGVLWSNNGGFAQDVTWSDPNLQVDLADADAVLSINELRQAFQIQRLLERDARGGTRYIEILKAHFGVTSPDARLQRPEYLGGGSAPVNISPVAQTSEDGGTPQANLAAIGTVGFSGHGFVKSFVEHCLLIGMVCVRADLTYQQGLERMFSRSTRFDFYWPALSHIGEQAVLQKEIYASPAQAGDDIVFGYQERYAEYRYKPSRITGLFRSGVAGSLDIWHLAQDFDEAPFTGPPTLDTVFISDVPPVDRVIAVPSEPHFLFDSHFKLKCARPMPVYGVPGLIDHF